MYEIINSIIFIVKFLFFVVVLFILYLIVNTIRLRKLNGPPIESAQLIEIPLIVETLSKKPVNGTFVMFSVPNTVGSDGDTVNVQFSIEKKKIGFDWLLETESNKKDRERFEEFSKREGMTVKRKSVSDFNYLRIEGDNPVTLATFGMNLLKNLYHLNSDSELQVFVDAPNWRINA